MADYVDIRELFNNSDLANRIDVATIKAASDLLSGTPTTEESKWAADVFDSPRAESKKAMMAVLAVNSSLTIVQIQQASDAQIQSNVNDVVSTLVIANTGV